MIKEFYRNRKVLITGHTGFKGTWLTEILLEAGANVINGGNVTIVFKFTMSDSFMKHMLLKLQ